MVASLFLTFKGKLVGCRICEIFRLTDKASYWRLLKSVSEISELKSELI